MGVRERNSAIAFLGAYFKVLDRFKPRLPNSINPAELPEIHADFMAQAIESRYRPTGVGDANERAGWRAWNRLSADGKAIVLTGGWNALCDIYNLPPEVRNHEVLVSASYDLFKEHRAAVDSRMFAALRKPLDDH